METFHFSPDLLRSLAWLLALLTVDYLGVIVAVCVDLHSGLRKASRLGQPRTSRGYRRTVDKGLRYLATLLSLTLVDVIMSLSAMCLRSMTGWNIPVMPLLTTSGALFMMLVEAKSVVENLHSEADLREAARTLSRLLSDRRLHEIARRIIER